MLTRVNITQKWFPMALMLFAFSLPVGVSLSNWVIGVLLLLWLPTLFTCPFFSHPALKKELWLSVGLFLIFLLGLAYTQNLKQGTKDLEHKLALLVFPLLLLTTIQVSKGILQRVLGAFAFSCVGISLYLLAVGIYSTIHSGDTSRLFYHQLAEIVGMHAVYLSAYLVFSSFILTHYLSRLRKASLNIKLILAASVFLLAVTILLLASKTIIAVYICVCVGLLFRHFYKKKKTSSGIALSIGLAFLILSVVNFVPYIKQRTDDVLNSNLEVLKQEEFRYDTEFSGLTLRLLFWKYAIEIIDQEEAWLLGIGTGDSQDALNKKYIDHKLYTGNGKDDTGYLDYDSHSQFVETLLKIGLVGLFYLIFYFGRNLYLSITARNASYTIFQLVFIAFSITESTLQTNKGILFFAFFNSLFIAYLRTREEVS